VYGTLQVSLETPGVEPEFAEVVEYFKDYTRNQFNLAYGTARLACRRKNETPMESALVASYPALKAIMDEGWLAQSCVFKAEGDLHVNWEDLKEDTRQLRGVIWDAPSKRYATTTLTEQLFTGQGLNRSILLVGGAGLNKTAMLHTLSRLMCRQMGKESYVIITSLDYAGVLTQRGALDQAACVAFDDVELVSRNSEPLSVDDQKHLFETRDASMYKARYCDAKFAPLTKKFFAANIDVSTRQSTQGNSFDAQLPWIRMMVAQEVPGVASLDEHSQACARRVAVFHVTEPLLNRDHSGTFRESDDQIMQERLENYERYLASRR
jgi:hypothetical protein